MTECGHVMHAGTCDCKAAGVVPAGQHCEERQRALHPNLLAQPARGSYLGAACRRCSAVQLQHCSSQKLIVRGIIIGRHYAYGNREHCMTEAAYRKRLQLGWHVASWAGCTVLNAARTSPGVSGGVGRVPG